MATFLIMLVSFGAFYAFGIFFKPVVSEFGWSRAATSGAASVSLMVTGILAIIMGGLTDKYGARFVITVGGILLGLGYFLMSKVTAIWQFYLFYSLIIGFGMTGSFIPPLSSVARWFTKLFTSASNASGVVNTLSAFQV